VTCRARIQPGADFFHGPAGRVLVSSTDQGVLDRARRMAEEDGCDLSLWTFTLAAGESGCGFHNAGPGRLTIVRPVDSASWTGRE